ncbi:MAG: proline racemase family protein [Thermoanaerobaculia bacterium]
MSSDSRAPRAEAAETKVTTVDAHAAGEPLRIVTGGVPEIQGSTMLEKRRFAQRELDRFRKLLIFEPRGHADMYGCHLTDPVTPDGDTGVLFFHNEGYSTMCGHAVIAMTKVGVEAGWFDSPVVRMDTPAGRVEATARLVDGQVESVSFVNVPSFVLERDVEIDVAGLGGIRLDVAFGGAFYAYVEAEDVGISIEPGNYRRIIDTAMKIKHAVMKEREIQHPRGPSDLDFLYGTILVQAGDLETGGEIHSRNVCVFADGEVDRSPTGTGVSGRAAIHHARGELGVGERIRIESLIGTSFDVEVLETTTVASVPAIVPRVTGTAHVTGRHQFVLDPADPLGEGVILR